MKKSYLLSAVCAFVIFNAWVSTAHAIAVRDIPNLLSITFWERTGGTAPTAYTFDINGSELTTRLSDPLSSSNNDFGGVPDHEFYDVFYSEMDGSFNLNGEYLTIEGIYDFGLPNGGGLNLAEIGLDFSLQPSEYGNWVASFTALGDNADSSTAGFAIDGDLQTNTEMGNTIGQTERLRITLGFESSSGPSPVPIPPAVWLFCSGLLGLIGIAKRKKSA